MDSLYSRLKTLHEQVWEHRAERSEIDDWLKNFEPSPSEEQLHALYLLSHFMYFGSRLLKELIKSLYRDLYKYPIIETIRRDNHDTIDLGMINDRFRAELEQTYFLGVGNPSESGCHLLYYFRQENALSKSRFIHSHQIFARPAKGSDPALRCPKIRRYVFIDDFCGSGEQGVGYTKEILEDIRAIDPSVHTAYYVLFATKEGLATLRSETLFSSVESIYELDESFKCFGSYSRFFDDDAPGIKDLCEATCRRYGSMLCPSFPLGYGDCQLLIGFHHNTPDNTLPVIWYDEPGANNWKPIFRRYPKYF